MPEPLARAGRAARAAGRYRHFRTLAEIAGAVLLLSGGAAAVAAVAPATAGTTIHGCENKTTGALRVLLKPGAKCPHGTRALSWNTRGPAGPRGPRGKTGTAALFGTNTSMAAAGTGETCTLGQIILNAGSVGGGVPAAGQLENISNNQPLFSIIGTEYGGNGTTTFALPDLRKQAPNGLTYSICVNGFFPSRS